MLFVLDGAKALHKAVRGVFGELAVIVRCRLHKERNVLDHLPETERPWVRRKLCATWANPNADEGEAALKALAARPEKLNPDAATSLRGRPRRNPYRHPARRRWGAAEDGHVDETSGVDDRNRAGARS